MFHVMRSLDCSFATMLIIGAIFHVNVYKACGRTFRSFRSFVTQILVFGNGIKTQDRHTVWICCTVWMWYCMDV